MNMIELAREIGKQLQKDEKYLALQMAIQATDEDEELQNMIGEFNLKKLAINNEATKSERDEEKLQQLNKEMRQVYAQIMVNEKMKAYHKAQGEVDELVKRIQTIISMCANGEDPETADYVQSSGCSGSCATCGGCH